MAYIAETPMSTVLTVWFILLVLLVYVRSIVNWRTRTRGRPLPPGPPTLPLVGNTFNMPRIKAWIGYRDLCAKYGDILHFQVLGQHIVVLGSSEVISEYLDKRSANTSDRKPTVMLELVGADIIFAFMRYGQLWRRHRRVFWQHFHPAASVEYRPIQRATSRRFLVRLLKDPTQFKDHIRYTFSAAMMRVVYNIDVEEDIEKQMEAVDATQEGISQGLIPGKYLVEFFPFLRHLPSYFLGAELREKSRKWIAAAMFLKHAPVEKVKAAMVQDENGGNQSMVGKSLMTVTQNGSTEVSLKEEEDIILNAAAVAFEGGSDTMYSTLQTTFLAMSLYPEILRKAQAELDAVVGPHRMPDFEDQDSLVYVDAIIKESLRWQNVLALSVPHCTTADDELHGYFIPAGTVLLPNTWACMHDPEAYEDPDEYRPERFIRDGKLDPTVRDPSAYVFGYGRRICPGRYFADAGLFINIASVLHVFDFGPPLDESGKPINIEPQMSDGLISYPEDCRCTIKVRSAQAEALILGTPGEA